MSASSTLDPHRADTQCMWAMLAAIVVMGWAVLAVFSVERQARIHRIRAELKEAEFEAARRDKMGPRRV